MGRSSRKDEERSAIAARNFTLPSEERVRAIAAGPPAHVRRLRAIEDLEEGIVRVLAAHFAEARALKMDGDVYARSKAPLRAVQRLADLIDRHNRWYPIEANLPMHLGTGELLDRTGLPWRPMARPDLAQLLERARPKARAGGGDAKEGAPSD